MKAPDATEQTLAAIAALLPLAKSLLDSLQTGETAETEADAAACLAEALDHARQLLLVAVEHETTATDCSCDDKLHSVARGARHKRTEAHGDRPGTHCPGCTGYECAGLIRGLDR